MRPLTTQDQLAASLLDEVAAAVRERLDERLDDVVRGLIEELADEPVMLDTAGLARRYGFEAAWIRKNAVALGGTRKGSGPRPRWRFRVSVADARFEQLGAEPRDTERVTTASRTRSRTRKAPSTIKPRNVLPVMT